MKKVWFFGLATLVACGTELPEVNSVGDTVEEQPMDTMSTEEMVDYVENSQPDSALETATRFEYPKIPTTDAEVQVEDVALYVMGLLSQQKLAELASFTHPDHRVWISPSTYLNENTFSADGALLGKLFESDEVIRWYDVTIEGSPMELTFGEYFPKYVWEKNYLQGDQYINEFIKRGPIVHNIQSNFPDCDVVEILVEGDEELDWRALNLVFQTVEDKFYLVAIIHDQYII